MSIFARRTAAGVSATDLAALQSALQTYISAESTSDTERAALQSALAALISQRATPADLAALQTALTTVINSRATPADVSSALAGGVSLAAAQYNALIAAAGAGGGGGASPGEMRQFEAGRVPSGWTQRGGAVAAMASGIVALYGGTGLGSSFSSFGQAVFAQAPSGSVWRLANGQIQEVDAATGALTGPAYPVPGFGTTSQQQAFCVLPDGSGLLVAGGFNGTDSVRTSYTFAFATRLFTQVGDCPRFGRMGAIGITGSTITWIPQTVGISSSSLGGNLDTRLIYNPATSSWLAPQTLSPALPSTVDPGGAAMPLNPIFQLADGRLYFVDTALGVSPRRGFVVDPATGGITTLSHANLPALNLHLGRFGGTITAITQAGRIQSFVESTLDWSPSSASSGPAPAQTLPRHHPLIRVAGTWIALRESTTSTQTEGWRWFVDFTPTGFVQAVKN